MGSAKRTFFLSEVEDEEEEEAAAESINGAVNGLGVLLRLPPFVAAGFVCLTSWWSTERNRDELNVFFTALAALDALELLDFRATNMLAQPVGEDEYDDRDELASGKLAPVLVLLLLMLPRPEPLPLGAVS
jgi:hypothetical protein